MHVLLTDRVDLKTNAAVLLPPEVQQTLIDHHAVAVLEAAVLKNRSEGRHGLTVLESELTQLKPIMAGRFLCVDCLVSKRHLLEVLESSMKIRVRRGFVIIIRFWACNTHHHTR